MILYYILFYWVVVQTLAPIGPPRPPIPIPGVSKSLLPGAINLEKERKFWHFHDFYMKNSKIDIA